MSTPQERSDFSLATTQEFPAVKRSWSRRKKALVTLGAIVAALFAVSLVGQGAGETPGDATAVPLAGTTQSTTSASASPAVTTEAADAEAAAPASSTPGAATGSLVLLPSASPSGDAVPPPVPAPWVGGGQPGKPGIDTPTTPRVPATPQVTTTPRVTVTLTQQPVPPVPTKTVTRTPKPRKTQSPTIDEVADDLYANCAEVREAGKDPLYRGDPGYSTKLDRDKDGIACE